MRIGDLRLLCAALAWTLVPAAAQGQEPPPPQAMQLQAQRIAQERPPEAEAAARQFLQQIAPDRVGSLDSLKAQAPDAYWLELGQLMVQREMVQQVSRRDTVRAQKVALMFGIEARARALQRAYRDAGEPQRPAIRGQLETLMTRHFEIEDQLRGLEIADIERRLSEVRAESERRRQKRAELVRWAVDDIVRDALRPT